MGGTRRNASFRWEQTLEATQRKVLHAIGKPPQVHTHGSTRKTTGSRRRVVGVMVLLAGIGETLERGKDSFLESRRRTVEICLPTAGVDGFCALARCRGTLRVCRLIET